MKSCVIFYGIGRNILEFNLFFNFLRRNLIDTDFYYFLHKEVDIIKNKRTSRTTTDNQVHPSSAQRVSFFHVPQRVAINTEGLWHAQ